jgi:hypothetical protein
MSENALPDHLTNNDPDRVTFTPKGRLDEVCSTKGAHLEHLDGNRWFLSFEHSDGTSSAFWFRSADLKKPFWEKRDASPL